MAKKGGRIVLSLIVVFSSFAILSFSQERKPSPKPGFITDIAFSRTQTSLEVKILLVSSSHVRIFKLSDPNRIVLDLSNMGDVKSYRYFVLNDFGIATIRVGMFKTDVARVVFDLKDQFPEYKPERIQDGVKLIFFKEGVPPPETEVIAKEIPEKTPVAPEVAKEPEKLVSEKPVSEKIELEKKEEKLEKTKRILDEEINILSKDSVPAASQRKNFFRIEAVGHYFHPQGSLFKNVYKGGIMYGGELNIGFLNFLELWLSEKNFSKTAIREDTGEERKVNLIPLEAGLKIRALKGNINPYIGLGAGLYQYRETNIPGEIREKKLGFITQVGCFIKIGGYLILDIYAHYSYCEIPFQATKFNVGGLHLGLGLGFEY